MRIVVDVSPLSHRRTGIGNYLQKMVQGLAEAAAGGHEIVAFAPTGVRGRRRVAAALAGLPVERRLVTLPSAHTWRTAWSRLAWPPADRLLGRFDVLHFSDWMYPPQARGLRATTIHDLVPLRFPELVQPRTRGMHGAKYRNAAATCDVVFANSRYTANDTVQLLGVEPERVHVAYPAIDARFAPKGPRAHLGAPYVLAVSTLEPRKNLGALLAAFDRLAHRRPELRLVVAGATGWGTLERPADERVRLLGFVEDDRLAELYRGAAVFAYPSRFEGFGLPVVEALASGTPAVASAHASLDEASGDTALRADPDDAVAFAEALEHALALPEEARRRGVEHARAFTPLRCGQAVLAGYEAALRH